MADERVVIQIDVDTRGGREITALQKQMAAMERQNQRLIKQQRLQSEQFMRIKDRTDLVSRSFMKMRTVTGTMVGLFAKFNSILSALAIATLPLLNAAFAAGRLVAKAYHGAMQLVAAGVAAVGAAAAVAMSAFREYSAALQSFAYRDSNTFVTQTQAAAASLRSLQRDTELAVFGLTGLSDAFVQVSQNSRFSGQSQAMLRQLADFAAAGGDPAKNIAAAGAFIGLLQKEGKLTQEVLAAGQRIGPQFAKALDEAKKRGMSSIGDFQRMLASGELGVLGGVAGQAGRVRGTLFGQFKSYLTEAFTVGADIGDALLGPAKKALDEIANSLLSVLRRVGPSIAEFGRGSFLDGLVSGFIKMEEFLVKLFREYLPRTEGMLTRFAQRWREVVYVFEDIVDRLRPFLDFGRAIMDVFGPAFTRIFTAFGEKYRNIGELIEDNREQFERFGQNLERFVNLFFQFGVVLEESFAQALPIINALAEAFLTMSEAVLGVVSGIGQLGSVGGFASLAMLLGGAGFIRGGGKGRRFMTRQQRQNIRQGLPAGSAVINNRLGRFGILSGNAGGGIFFGNVGPRSSPFVPNVPQQPTPFQDFKNYAAAITRGTTLQQYQAYRGYGGKTRMDAARRALRGSVAQGRMTRGFAPTGMGAGMASMLASTALMNSMQFADTGLGTAGQTVSSLGAMAGMFNPLAGLGLTMAGGALGAQTPGGGALMGAGAGAAFGTMVGGPVGAAVGAMIGAAIGGITGAINRYKGEAKKLREDAKRAGFETMGMVAQSFLAGGDFSQAGAIAGGLGERADYIRGLGIEGMSRTARAATVTSLYEAGRITEEEMETLKNGVTEYVEQLDIQEQNVRRVTKIIETGFNEKMQVLTTMTGKSREELIQMANAMGVNLFDATTSAASAVVELGLATERTAEQIIGAVRDIQVAALDPLRQTIASAEAMQGLTQVESAFKELGQSATANDARQLLLDYVDLLNIANPNSPLSNLVYAQTLLTEAIKPGGFLEAQAALIQGSGTIGAAGTAIGETRAGMIESLAGDIVTGLAAREGVAADVTAVERLLGGLSNEQLDQLLQDVVSGEIFSTFGRKVLRAEGQSFQLGSLGGLGQFGVTAIDQAAQSEALLNSLSEDQRAMYMGIQDAVKNGFADNPSWYDDEPKWFKEYPVWFGDKDGKAGPPDTRTPRGDTTTQRLGRTIGRHNYFNSMLTGKRTITSAFRTNNLGSINSDHVTGRAYDLVGQNLGQYATLVNQSGGFAEFHGRGGNRHLHVVPGQGPMGDASMPSIPMLTPGAPSGSTYNYSVVVNGANADANEIATKVMDKIQRIERDRRERG